MSRSCTAANSSPAAAAVDDRVLEPEFEAAEVLASLSKSPKPPSSREASVGGGGGAGESVDSWGSRSKRSTVRVKSESSPVDSALNSATTAVAGEEAARGKRPVLLAFDLNEDEGTTFNQEEECIVKDEDVELAEPSRVCTTSGGKSRHTLTEAQKEARRLRRVLANRESARQTIRRRQALYEELNRTVIDLARQNENLKREKELAVRDYEDLKCTNKKLKEQVAGQLGSNLQENLMPDHMNPTQLGYYGSTSQSEANMREASNSEPPNDKGKPLGHWCMVPCPIFFPVHDVKNGPNLFPFFPAGDGENETGVDNQRAGTSSSKFVTSPKDLYLEYHTDVKKEVSAPAQARLEKTTYEIPLGLSRDVADTSSLECGRTPSDVIREAMGIKLVSAQNSESFSSKGVHDVNHLQEHHKEPVVSLGKRLVDPAAAAKARKRRKELTRLKSLHCRAHRKEGLRT